MRLAGKSAIVTGAGRGIGKATALRFAHTFLASDEASYITGQTYNVCGGLQLN
jgi:NAD(P)-dependent dehydrogenase (short-subunit alcohol dehydrogenase family)